MMQYRRRGLILHTRILEHVGPLAALPSVTVLQMLPEVICAEEFFRMIALAKLVFVVQMFHPDVPVGRIGILFSTVAADVAKPRVSCMSMKCIFKGRKRSTGP